MRCGRSSDINEEEFRNINFSLFSDVSVVEEDEASRIWTQMSFVSSSM